MFKYGADAGFWFFAFRICPLKEKLVIKQAKNQHARHFCIVFEIVFNSLACCIEYETSNTKLLPLWQVYESWDSFKVNDVLEVYGILSVDPVLSIVNNEER